MEVLRRKSGFFIYSYVINSFPDTFHMDYPYSTQIFFKITDRIDWHNSSETEWFLFDIGIFHRMVVGSIQFTSEVSSKLSRFPTKPSRFCRYIL